MQVRIMLAILVAAQLGDAVTFMIGQELHGIGLESNGLAVAAYHAAGLQGVMLLKCAAIIFVLTTLVRSAGRFPRLLVWGGAAATAMGMLGIAANVTSLVILAG
ncbi:MAG TPA: hypothetical protein VF013_00070 [Candidatus Limnocylindria bacterium]